MVVIVIAIKNPEEQRLLVAKRGIERRAFYTRSLRKVRVRRAFVPFFQNMQSAASSAFEEAVRSEMGSVQLDILVNNAGIAPEIPFEETSVETFEAVINVNLKAPYFLTQAASNFIRNDGRIINISTGFTRVAGPERSIYAASKGGIETLTLALAPLFAAKGITVNAVRPGVTATDMNKDWLADPAVYAGAASMSAFGRIGATEDIADIVVFLASEEARWITGQFIDATGGSRL